MLEQPQPLPRHDCGITARTRRGKGMPGERGAVCVGKRRPTWSMLKPGRPHAYRRRRDATNICAMKNIGVTRMQEFGETVFATFSARAAELGAINLGQGFPDTDGPNAMLERAQQEIARGNNQYPPGLGMPVLREAVACHQSRYGRTIDPATQVLITVGATEAITAAVTALVEPGEEVIVFEPYFDSYAAAISLAGGRRVAVSLKPAGDTWTLDTKAFEQAITPQTKLVICNSPHNPTGAVFDRAVLEEFARIVVAHDLLVVSDEVYEHLVFPPATHTHLASLPEMWERTVSVSSAAKTFNATGWKTGWAVGPQPLIKEVQRVKQYLSYVGAAPFQPAVAYALDNELAWVDAMAAGLAKKKQLLADALRAAGLKVYDSHGTYYLVAEVPEAFADDMAFCTYLIEEVGVAAIPISVFCDHKDDWRRKVRFAFCKKDETLIEACRRIQDRLHLA